MKAITIVRAVQTCMACPSQWDAWDVSGQYYYLRFRHGYGTVTRYEDENWVDADTPQISERTTEFEYCSDKDLGVISLEEFCAKADIRLSPSLILTGFGDHLAYELTMRGIPLQQATDITEPWRQLNE